VPRSPQPDLAHLHLVVGPVRPGDHRVVERHVAEPLVVRRVRFADLGAAASTARTNSSKGGSLHPPAFQAPPPPMVREAMTARSVWGASKVGTPQDSM
jgi:hypothetical protein